MSKIPPLTLLPERLAFVRFAPSDPLPAWVFHAGASVWSVTRTPRELSLLCPEDDLPPSIAHAQRGWRAFEVDGPMPLQTVGVIAALAPPLAEAGLPISVISTHDTDLLLVRESDLPRALAVLRAHFEVREP